MGSFNFDPMFFLVFQSAPHSPISILTPHRFPGISIYPSRGSDIGTFQTYLHAREDVKRLVKGGDRFTFGPHGKFSLFFFPVF